MDKTTLVERDISEGKKIIEKLDMTKYEVAAALWFYSSELSQWRLIIASDYVDINGPKKAYAFIQKELSSIPDGMDLNLNNIRVVSTKNDLIELLGIAVKTDAGISGIRFSRNVINNVLIEDAYIYRMNLPVRIVQ